MGHISQYTAVRGPDISRNVIVSAYVAFYQINKFFVNILFFSMLAKCLSGQMKWLADRIWPVGRSLETLL